MELQEQIVLKTKTRRANAVYIGVNLADAEKCTRKARISKLINVLTRAKSHTVVPGMVATGVLLDQMSLHAITENILERNRLSVYTAIDVFHDRTILLYI